MKNNYEFPQEYHHKDAPEAIYDKAHYVDGELWTGLKLNNNSEFEKNRRVCFHCGRSVKNYWLSLDKPDHHAIELLKKHKRERLVIKFHLVPDRKVLWAHLTDFGIFHQLKNGYLVINPDTGEEGFYHLAE